MFLQYATYGAIHQLVLWDSRDRLGDLWEAAHLVGRGVNQLATERCTKADPG